MYGKIRASGLIESLLWCVQQLSRSSILLVSVLNPPGCRVQGEVAAVTDGKGHHICCLLMWQATLFTPVPFTKILSLLSEFRHFSPSIPTPTPTAPYVSTLETCSNLSPLKNTTKRGYDLKCAVSSLSTLLQLSFLERVSGRWGNKTLNAASSPAYRLKAFFSASIILAAKFDEQLSATSHLTSLQCGLLMLLFCLF